MYFIWDENKRTKKVNATFPVGYYAWFPYDVMGNLHKSWINVLNKNKTEITVRNAKLDKAKCKKRRENDKSRKFVTFAKTNINGQIRYEFIGIFKLIPGGENIFRYKKTSEEFNGM